MRSALAFIHIRNTLSVLTLVFLLGLSFGSQSFLLVHAQPGSGSDVTLPGQNLSRTFYSPDSAPSSPNLLWKFQMNGPPGLFACVVVGGVVYQGCLGTGDIYAVNETTGTQIWHINVNNTAESLTYYNGYIYTQGGSLPYNTLLRSFGDEWICLDAATGKIVWIYQIPPDEWVTPNIGSYGNPPIIVNDKMYIPVYNGIATLNATTGAIIDRWNLLSQSFYSVYSNGDIFTVAKQSDGLYYAVRAGIDNHTIEWTSHDNNIIPVGHSDVGAGEFSSLALSGDLYVNEYNFSGGVNGVNSVYKVESQDGAIDWQFNYIGYAINVAVGYNNLYFATSAGNVYAVDKTEGTTATWQVSTASVLTPVAVADQKVFFGAQDSYIYALDALTGDVVWKYRTGGSLLSEPVIANNDLFIASKDNYLYAFGIPPPKPTSALVLSTSPKTANQGTSFTITGKLADQNGVGFADANVTLQEQLVPQTIWTNLTSVITDSNGNFKYAWTPSVPGYYNVQATYAGDSLAPALSTYVVDVSAPEPLTPYLIAIIVLEIIIIALAVILILSKRPR